MNPRYTDMCKHIGVISGPWQPRYKWKPVKLTTYRKCFLLSRQEAAGSEVHRFKAANKVRKNWPKSIKKCLSSLFCFITQAVADPNHPTQFHPHLGLLPALLNMQGHCPSGKGQHLSTTDRSAVPLYQGLLKEITEHSSELDRFPRLGAQPPEAVAALSVPTTHSPGHGAWPLCSKEEFLTWKGFPTYPCLSGFHSVSADDL